MASPDNQKKANQRYIAEKVDPFLNKMLLEMLEASPQNVLKYMAEWIYKEQNPDYIRKALSGNPGTYGQDAMVNRSFEASIHSKTPKELSRRGSQQRLDSDYEGSPDGNGHSHRNRQGRESSDNYSKPDVSSEENSDEEQGDNVPDLDQNLATKLKKAKPPTRTSVSAEVYGANNQKKVFKARVIAKDSQVKLRIRGTLLKSFLFRALEEKDLETCIDAMEVKTFQ